MNGSYSVPIGSSRSPLIAVRQSERRQQDEQVHLGDAELDMLALRREFPIEGRGDALALERVGHRLAREQAAPVHPRSEIGRDRDVRRRRDDAARELVFAAADLVENGAEAGLRRHHRLNRDRQVVRHIDAQARSGGARLRPRTARGRGTLAVAPPAAAGLRTCPIHGRAAHSSPCGRSPSAPASSGRRGCPCGPAIGRPKPLTV